MTYRANEIQRHPSCASRALGQRRRRSRALRRHAIPLELCALSAALLLTLLPGCGNGGLTTTTRAPVDSSVTTTVPSTETTTTSLGTETTVEEGGELR